MHESGIAANLLALAREAAEQNGLSRVSQVVVQVGEFTGVEVPALEFAFRVLTRATRFEGAALVIERVPILLGCRACESQYPASLDDTVCPVCGAQDFDILQGRELVLRTIRGHKNDG